MCNWIFLVNLPIVNFAKPITLATDTINHIVDIHVNLQNPHISLNINVNGWLLCNIYSIQWN